MFEVVDNVFVLGVHSDLPVGGEGFVRGAGVGKRFHLTALSEKILAWFNLPKKENCSKAVVGLLSSQAHTLHYNQTAINKLLHAI